MLLKAYLEKLKDWVKIGLELGKIRITFMVMVTTAMGYLMAAGVPDFDILYPLVGTFLLACGSAALNQWQDREYDRRMYRTRLRPLPSGKVTPLQVLVISFIWAASGAAILGWGAGWIPCLLGILTLLWYNGVYTYLKRLTTWAVIPGSLIGAIPPIIGWTAVGGSTWDLPILAVASFIFIWQIPHFWLILIFHQKDYAKSSLPLLTDKVAVEALGKWIYGGIVLTALSGLSLFYFQALYSSMALSITLLGSLWIAFTTLPLARGDMEDCRTAFHKINIYALSVVILVMVDSTLVLI